MINFFRKKRKALANENRSLKYARYAIGEIVLVMVGILLALQVSNWNEQRKNSNKETRVLQQLHIEFKANKAQLKKVVSYHKKAFNATKKIINLIPVDIEQVNIDSLGRYLRSTRYRWTFNPSQGTINTLTSTSSFNIISNIELRELLLQWDDMVKDYIEEEIASADFTKNQYSDYLRYHFPIKYKLRHKKLDLSFLNSISFENIVLERDSYLRDILGAKNDTIKELDRVFKTIDKIIELSKTD